MTQADNPHMGTSAIGKVATRFIPAELKDLPRWNTWRYKPNRKDPTKKAFKVPYRSDGHKATPTDAFVDHWSSFAAAYNKHQSSISSGLGFLFIKADPYTGIDVDNCLDPETGQISEFAGKILGMFPGSYREISPSETGLKLWVRGKKPEWCTKCKKKFDDEQQVEIYDSNHYFTVTGNAFGEPVERITNHEPEIAQLCEELFPKEDHNSTNQTGPTELDLDDQGYLNLLYSFENAENFRKLYEEGDLSGHKNDWNRADLALCTHLAFVTRDIETIDRIFRSSALYREDKWERETYGLPTIKKALEYQDDFYDPSLSFLRPTIKSMYMDVLRIKWDDYRDPLIMMAHLEMAHKSCNYRGENIIWDASLGDVRKRTNIHRNYISERTNAILKSEYPLSRPFRGAHGKRSRYMIAPAGDDTPRTYTHEIGEEQIRIIRYLRLRASYCHLSYRSQWALIQIVAHQKIPTEDLKDIMEYIGATKSFRKRVLKPIKDKKLIREKDGILHPSGNTGKKITRHFDEDKFHHVVMEVMEESREYMRNLRG